jgi:hypothetical protein
MSAALKGRDNPFEFDVANTGDSELELEQELERCVDELVKLAQQKHKLGYDGERISGKIEGVRLALSKLRERR